jgi:hypothetical protein
MLSKKEQLTWLNNRIDQAIVGIECGAEVDEVDEVERFEQQKVELAPKVLVHKTIKIKVLQQCFVLPETGTVYRIAGVDKQDLVTRIKEFKIKLTKHPAFKNTPKGMILKL